MQPHARIGTGRDGFAWVFGGEGFAWVFEEKKSVKQIKNDAVIFTGPHSGEFVTYSVSCFTLCNTPMTQIGSLVRRAACELIMIP